MELVYNKLLIVDGSYLLHRQLHQKEIFELRAANGERSGGVFGFLRSLNREILNCPEYFPVVVFDQGLCPRRVAADENYKHAKERAQQANVILTPEESDCDYVEQYRIQRNKLIILLSFFGIPSIKIYNWEGDDIMYILSKLSRDSIVLTDDRDMLQLLSPTCKVKRPMAKEMWTLESFLEDKNLSDTFEYVICKAITGDGSDNIPGSCKGVGGTNATNLSKVLRTYSIDRSKNLWDSMDNYPSTEKDLRDLCDQLGVKYRAAYLNIDRDRFIKNMELVDLNLVEFDEDVLDSISSTLSTCRNSIDFFAAMKMLSDLSIREFPADVLIENVYSRYCNLLA